MLASEMIEMFCDYSYLVLEKRTCEQVLPAIEELSRQTPDDEEVQRLLLRGYANFRQVKHVTDRKQVDSRLRSIADALVELNPQSVDDRFNQAMTRDGWERIDLLQLIVDDFGDVPPDVYLELGRALLRKAQNERGISAMKEAYEIAMGSDREEYFRFQLRLAQSATALTLPLPATGDK